MSLQTCCRFCIFWNSKSFDFHGYRLFSLSAPLLPLGFSCSSQRFFLIYFWMCEEVMWPWNFHLWRNWAAVWKAFFFLSFFLSFFFFFALTSRNNCVSNKTKKNILNWRWFRSSAACATALAVSIACFISKKKKKILSWLEPENIDMPFSTTQIAGSPTLAVANC